VDERRVRKGRKKRFCFGLKGKRNYISQVPWIKNKKTRKKKFRMGGARSKKGSPGDTTNSGVIPSHPLLPPQFKCGTYAFHKPHNGSNR